MKPTIHVALTHDWELRGNGSGDIEEIQFRPLRRLLEIYKNAGVKTTFMPDLMQQLTFRSGERQHAELKALADKWDDCVREAFQQGHDIQLHLHPQWREAKYQDGSWRLTSDWSILNYEAEQAFEMLKSGKQYLEELLQPLDSSFRCVAFRAGALAVAPSNHLLTSLIKLGIELDVSLAGGMFFETPDIRLDFRDCDEAFLPFYPNLSDARKVSDKQEEIVCVPIHHFYGSRVGVFRSNAANARRKLTATSQTPTAAASAARTRSNSLLSKVYEKGVVPLVQRKYLIVDTARLSYPLLRESIRSMRRLAEFSGWSDVPIVLTNHPKEIADYSAIERFLDDLLSEINVKFISLTELAHGIRNGVFSVVKR
jgi:hypothetical protein